MSSRVIHPDLVRAAWIAFTSPVPSLPVVCYLATGASEKYTKFCMRPGRIWIHTRRITRLYYYIMRNDKFYWFRKNCVGTAKHRGVSDEKIWYLPLRKTLAPRGIWTHTDRAGEGKITLCVLIHLPSNPGLVASLLAVAVYDWKSTDQTAKWKTGIGWDLN